MKPNLTASLLGKKITTFCVVCLATEKDVWTVLKIIQEIEIKLGRENLRKKGEARTIDIDILPLYLEKKLLKQKLSSSHTMIF